MLSSVLFLATLALSSVSDARPVADNNQLRLADWALSGISNLGNDVRIQRGWEWTDCGYPESGLDIKSLKVSPDPPEPGKDLTINADVEVKTRVDEGAYADVTVKLGLIKLLTKRFDLCEEMRNANTSIQCPVEPGEYQIEHTVPLPREIPRAKFSVDAEAFTVDEDDLGCVKIKIDFMDRPF